jgi:hypothetical protein
MPNTKIGTIGIFWKMLAGLSTKLFASALLVAFSTTTLVSSARAEQPAIATAEAPDIVAKNFYVWYLKELSKNRDPLSDSAATMRTYVSSRTLAKIRRMINSPDGMEADYFLQTQDYMEEWLPPPKSQIKKIGNTNSELVVTLGENTENKYQLSVTMLKEEGRWKISKVIALTH